MITMALFGKDKKEEPLVDMFDVSRKRKARDITGYKGKGCGTFELILDDIFSQVPGAGQEFCVKQEVWKGAENDAKVDIGRILKKWDEQPKILDEDALKEKREDLKKIRQLTSKLKMIQRAKGFCRNYQELVLKPMTGQGDGTYSFSLCQDLSTYIQPEEIPNLLKIDVLSDHGIPIDFWDKFFRRYNLLDYFAEGNKGELQDGTKVFKIWVDGKTNVPYRDAFNELLIWSRKYAKSPLIRDFFMNLPAALEKVGRLPTKDGALSTVGGWLAIVPDEETADLYKRVRMDLSDLKLVNKSGEPTGTWDSWFYGLDALYYAAFEQKAIPDTSPTANLLEGYPNWFVDFVNIIQRVPTNVLKKRKEGPRFSREIRKRLRDIASQIGDTDYLVEGIKGLTRTDMKGKQVRDRETEETRTKLFRDLVSKDAGAREEAVTMVLNRAMRFMGNAPKDEEIKVKDAEVLLNELTTRVTREKTVEEKPAGTVNWDELKGVKKPSDLIDRIGDGLTPYIGKAGKIRREKISDQAKLKRLEEIKEEIKTALVEGELIKGVSVTGKVKGRSNWKKVLEPIVGVLEITAGIGTPKSVSEELETELTGGEKPGMPGELKEELVTFYREAIGEGKSFLAISREIKKKLAEEGIEYSSELYREIKKEATG